MPDPHSNFGYSTVATAPSPASSGTSLVVQAGDGAKFPSTGAFNATIWPVSTQPTAANAEIVRVTAISTDTFTITRAQESSSARTVVVGDQIADTVTAKTLTDVELDVYVTASDKTVPATTQVIFDDYLEVAASFFYELSTDAILAIGDFATPTFGPGYEIGYDQITAGVNIVGLTQSTGTTIITCASHFFDGGPVIVEFYTSNMAFATVAGNGIGVTLNENGAAICDLAFMRSGVATTQQPFAPFVGRLRFSPTAGYHNYVITAYTASTTGTPAVSAQSGTGGLNVPAYVRFTKV